MSITTGQATTLLENVLFESQAVAQTNASYWVGLSQSVAADATIAGAATAMAATAEAGIAEQVVRYYEGALGRIPAGSEVAYYVAFAETGLSQAQIAQGVSGVAQANWNQISADFAASPEFTANYAGASPVSYLYLTILGRSPAASETAYYNAQLTAGAGVSQLLQEFVNSPEYTLKVNPTIAAALAQNGTAIANGQPGTLGRGVIINSSAESAHSSADTAVVELVGTHHHIAALI